jgi:hypothetical protein
MKQRLPIILSATALVIALFGSTPLGQAVVSVVPFAKKAGYATNAGAVGKIKASSTPKPGFLVPLGSDGKFPAAVGQSGPAGPQGAKGEKGDKGDKGVKGDPAATTIVTAGVRLDGGLFRSSRSGTTSAHVGTGRYRVEIAGVPSGVNCVATVTPIYFIAGAYSTSVEGGGGVVLVQIYNSAGAYADHPFNLIAVC